MTLTFDLKIKWAHLWLIRSRCMKFIIIGGLQSQLWSGNRFQSLMPHDVDLWPFAPKSIGHILDSWGASVWSFMIIGGLQDQLWSWNHFLSSLPYDLDLWPQNQMSTFLTHKEQVYEVHHHRWITESVMVWKPFSITNAPWPWPLTFCPKINRAHSWLMGSKCMKFHDHRLITESVIVRKPFTINHAPWPLTFWPQNQ